MNTSPSRFLILLTVISLDLLTGMEFDLFVPAFPQMQNHFQLTPFWVEALLSANFLGYCSSLFFIGVFSDRYGRKPVILFGLIIFIIGSFLCLSPHFYSLLLIGRFLQGIGIAAPSILSFLIIADIYPLKDQQFLMGVLNGTMNLAVAISPVMGSYITLYFNWQGNFSALAILGIATLMMTIIFIPHQKMQSSDSALSLHGYLAILKSKPLMLLITYIIFIIVPYWVFVGMSPLLYIKELNVSLEHFGYYQGALAFVFAIGSILFGFMLKHADIPQKRMLILSTYMLLISTIIFVAVTILDVRNPLIITLAFLPFIISQIIPSVILYPLALNILPQAKAKISALIQGGKYVLTAIGLQIAGYFYHASFQNIGIVVSVFIVGALVLQYFVVHNEEINPEIKQ